MIGLSRFYIDLQLLDISISYMFFLLQKLQSWFQLPNGNWELGKILSASGTETVISLPNEKV